MKAATGGSQEDDIRKINARYRADILGRDYLRFVNPCDCGDDIYVRAAKMPGGGKKLEAPRAELVSIIPESSFCAAAARILAHGWQVREAGEAK